MAHLRKFQGSTRLPAEKNLSLTVADPEWAITPWKRGRQPAIQSKFLDNCMKMNRLNRGGIQNSFI